MAGRIYLSLAYVIPRFVIWSALSIAAAVDGWRHRSVRSRGWQLYAALVVVSFLFTFRDCFVLAYAVQDSDPDTYTNEGIFDAYIFFSNLADSTWIFVLLLISAGYCITRNGLGPHKAVCISIPLIFFISSLVVDYVLFYVKGFSAFSDEPSYYEGDDGSIQTVSPFTGLAFFVSVLASTMTFILAWFFIFDTIEKEKRSLEASIAAGPGAATAAARGSGQLPASHAPGGGEGGDGGGHSMLPANAVLLEEGANASHLYDDVVGHDLDAPKSVQERIADREKLRLIRSFFFGVSAYVVATVLVLFLPVFAPALVDRIILVLQNVLLWLFLGALLWAFRMRPGNPYLVLSEEGGGGGAEMTTELGVMAGSDDDDELGPPPPPLPGSTMSGKPLAPAPSPPQRFTLGSDEEDELELGNGANAHAAQRGVVVRALPGT